MHRTRHKRQKRKRRTASARRETPQAAQKRESDRRRTLCDLNLFWMDCRKRPCIRARACRGDAQACFMRNWPPMEERERSFRRNYVSALHARRTPDEAIVYALACALKDAERAGAGVPLPLPSPPRA
jgi:hypothetical protein